MSVHTLFESLWKAYIETNPKVLDVHRMLSQAPFNKDGSEQAVDIVNDHIALRTLKHPRFGLAQLASVFEVLGYQIKARYRFEQKKLDAVHLEHADNAMHPKVFISELCLNECSELLQGSIQTALIDKCRADLDTVEVLPASGVHWGVPSYSVYQALLDESEYAAWFYVFGFVPNHFTVRVNALRRFQSIHELNDYLEAQGIVLNSVGGKVKGTPELFLEQSSTMADRKMFLFEEGEYEVPSVFYEFAQRHNMPSGEEFSGFIEGNADKIFESTNVR